jgi:hypothetical protein
MTCVPERTSLTAVRARSVDRAQHSCGKALEEWAHRTGFALNLIESFVAERETDIWNDFVAVLLRALPLQTLKNDSCPAPMQLSSIAIKSVNQSSEIALDSVSPAALTLSGQSDGRSAWFSHTQPVSTQTWQLTTFAASPPLKTNV